MFDDGPTIRMYLIHHSPGPPFQVREVLVYPGGVTVVAPVVVWAHTLAPARLAVPAAMDAVLPPSAIRSANLVEVWH